MTRRCPASGTPADARQSFVDARGRVYERTRCECGKQVAVVRSSGRIYRHNVPDPDLTAAELRRLWLGAVWRWWRQRPRLRATNKSSS